MAWYRTGTVAVTNGSTTVTGTSTSWIAGVGIGEAFYGPDGRIYEIANIVSATQLTLGSGYLGTSTSGQDYQIVPTQSYIRDLAAQASQLVADYAGYASNAGTGKFDDGTVAVPGVRFVTDEDTGLYRIGANNLGIAAGGTKIVDVASTGITVTGAVNSSSGVISANSATNALRITQTGAGNALLVEDAANPDANPFIIDADGKVLSGHTTTQAFNYAPVPRFQINGTSQSTGAISSFVASAPAAIPSALLLGRAKGTQAAPTVVASGDDIGLIQFEAHDGTALIPAASILAEVDGTPGTNDMPGRLVFSTTKDGASSPTEALRIDSAQGIGVGGGAGVGDSVRLIRNMTGAAATTGLVNRGVVQSDATTSAVYFQSTAFTQAAAFTLPTLKHYSASQSTIGVGSTVTNQYGFMAESNVIGATNNYGFFSNIPSGTGRWNFYAGGSADNYFAGTVAINSTPATFSTSLSIIPKLQVNAAGAATAGISRFSANSSANSLWFLKSRGATVGDFSTVVSGDSLGAVGFLGTNGTDGLQAATILAAVDGTPSSTSMPGRLVFSTTADGASSPTERMRIDSAGRVGIGGSPFSGVGSLLAAKSITGNAFSYGILSSGTVQSDVTSAAYYFRTTATTQATTFTLSGLSHFQAEQGTLGASSTVTNQYGFSAQSSLTGATNNYGFYSNIASGTGRWNFYAAGSAANYFAGNVGIGVAPSEMLDVMANGRTFIQHTRYSDNTFSPVYSFRKARGTSAAPTIIQNGDEIGAIQMYGYDGAAFVPGGSISFFVNGTPGVNDMPVALGFRTATDGTVIPVDRIIVKPNGQVRFVPLAAAPAGAENGDVYYNSTTNKLQVYAAGAWVDLH